MKKIIFALPVLLLIGAGCASQQNGLARPEAAPGSPAGQQAAASVKFVDQPYYKQAYLISGDALDAEAKSALSGFDLTKTAQPDGSTLFTLKAVKPGYTDQRYSLKPGQKLYFIEYFLQDDDPVKNEDRNMKDDLGVVVDADGNVVQGPASWAQ